MKIDKNNKLKLVPKYFCIISFQEWLMLYQMQPIPQIFHLNKNESLFWCWSEISALWNMTDYVIIIFSVSVRWKIWIFMDESWICHWCLSMAGNCLKNNVLKIPWSWMNFYERPFVVNLEIEQKIDDWNHASILISWSSCCCNFESMVFGWILEVNLCNIWLYAFPWACCLQSKFSTLLRYLPIKTFRL